MAYAGKPRRAGNCGFSLLESLIVIMLVGILISTASFTFGKISRRVSLKREGMRIAEILRKTVIRAKATQLTQKISLSSESITEIRSAFGTTTEITTPLAQGVALFVPESRESIIFTPSGITSGVTLALESNNQRCAIILSLRGRVVSSC